MAGALLDTSVVIAGSDDISTLPESAAISIVTLGELYAGVALAQDDETGARRAARLAQVRRAFQPLVVDEPVAVHYGHVLAIARSQGRTAKATDLLILATALAHDRELHTLDERQAALGRAAGAAVAATA